VALLESGIWPMTPDVAGRPFLGLAASGLNRVGGLHHFMEADD